MAVYCISLLKSQKRDTINGTLNDTLNDTLEIVRRRLFADIGSEKDRDDACKAYAEMYKANPELFPPEVQEATYLDRMRKTYPLHPEIFDRLYADWSTLQKFQKTRGVLQYTARTIFLGSAPSAEALQQNTTRGLEQKRIVLGAAIPGQQLGVYEDVLDALRDQSRYLSNERTRFYYDTRPNLRREMEERKLHVNEVAAEDYLRGIVQHVCGKL